MFKITKYELESNFNLIIAHFSDIHYSTKFNLKKFVEIINKMKNLKPNYICITGDLIDNISVSELKEMKNLTDFLNELSKISTVILGLGNHDTRAYLNLEDNRWYDKLDKKIIVLNNSSYEDEFVYFYGLTMPSSYYWSERKRVNSLLNNLKKIKISKNKYNILLFHSPINLAHKMISEFNKFNLVLTGHTHNGLTPHFFPGNFGFISPEHRLFSKNARNSFNSGKAKVIISGGITKLAPDNGLGFLDKLFASDLVYIYFKKK